MQKGLKIRSFSKGIKPSWIHSPGLPQESKQGRRKKNHFVDLCALAVHKHKENINFGFRLQKWCIVLQLQVWTVPYKNCANKLIYCLPWPRESWEEADKLSHNIDTVEGPLCESSSETEMLSNVSPSGILILHAHKICDGFQKKDFKHSGYITAQEEKRNPATIWQRE